MEKRRVGLNQCTSLRHNSGISNFRAPAMPCQPIIRHAGWATLGLALVLTACGGGGSGTPAISTPAAVANALNLDFANLANYAAPALPAYYDATAAAIDNTPPGDPVTDKIATLGRVLFYDKNLSVNNAVSCASCHQQARGFDDATRFSTGFSGAAFTTAHAMRLGNIRYFRPGTAFWDRRAASVEAQASQPIQNPVEMGFDAAHGGLPALVAKLQALAYYPDLFTLAFGDSGISEARIQRALAQFERGMVSTSSRWDSGYLANFNPALPDRGLGLPIATFAADENRGRALFMNAPGAGGLGCVACHAPPTFALSANSRSNGLDAGETTVFKAPSLKSVASSAAFMHDGRFSTLAQVVEHYNSGVQAGPALDNRLIGPGGIPRQLNLSAPDKAALVAFLVTLNDPALVADGKFANPFKP